MTEEQIEIGRKMLDQGATWTEVAVTLRVSFHAVQWALKPGYRERRREQDRANRLYKTRKPKPAAGAIIGHSNGARSVSPGDAARALASVPPDTRNRTSRLFGDPLPGRSALDQRGASA